MLGDPLCDLPLTAYRTGPKQYFASTLLSKAPAVLTHALKTVRKS